jgi:hypothetical protein
MKGAAPKTVPFVFSSPVSTPQFGGPSRKVTSGHTQTPGWLTRTLAPAKITKRGETRAKSARKQGMSPEPSAFEQAIARALRDNLERIQRSSDELNQAVNDVVAACSSSKPSNALPPMLRAQSGAAALAASLEVLARFITLALNPAPRSPFEEQITQAIALQAPEAAPAPVRPTPQVPVPKAETPAPPPAAPPIPVVPEPLQHAAPPAPERIPVELEVTEPVVESNGEFDINRLTSEEQELHRRANRVAKVSMQDIKMLRPEQVRLGRENRDICIRLKDDIEKAHREYDRRFKPIMDHPVDYFYRWMVEILADGDASCLGEYPYATAGKAR